MFRRQTLSFQGSRSRTQTDDMSSGMQPPAVGARQQELEQHASEMQHLQQDVARLRQERDAARLQIGSISSKQAINTKSGGMPCHNSHLVDISEGMELGCTCLMLREVNMLSWVLFE